MTLNIINTCVTSDLYFDFYDINHLIDVKVKF